MTCILLLILNIALILIADSGTTGAGQKQGDQLSPVSRLEVLDPVLIDLPRRITVAIDNDRLISVSMAVVFDGEVVFLRAFGLADLAERRPATPGTIYPMGSITKVFTSIMLARLVERGVVDLEDPAQMYLPEYQPNSPFTGALPTTLRQLATHTSGLPRDAPVNFWCDYTGFLWLVTNGQVPMTWYVDCDSLLASLSSIELAYPPEVHAHYSNLNMQILGLALERACGRSLTEYIEDEVLTPLGMNESGFTLDPEQSERLATGYVCTGPTVQPLEAPAYDLGCAIYSGGLFTTAEDLARFLASVLRENRIGVRGILETGTLRRMRTPQSVHRLGVHVSYGLGWGVVRIGGHEAIEHNGALLGYHAHVSAVPDLGLGIVALSNTKNFLWRPNACKELARGVLADLADALVAAAEDVEFDPAAVDLGDYEGLYALPGGFAHLDIHVTDDVLTVTLTETPDFSENFSLTAPDEFCFTSDPNRKSMLIFERNSNDEVISVRFLSHTFRRVEPDN